MRIKVFDASTEVRHGATRDAMGISPPLCVEQLRFETGKTGERGYEASATNYRVRVLLQAGVPTEYIFFEG